MSLIESRLEDLGLCLPEPPVPVAAYLPSVVFSNNLVYVSGQDCRKDGQLLYKGKLGSDLTVDQGKECARQSKMCIRDRDWGPRRSLPPLNTARSTPAAV